MLGKIFKTKANPYFNHEGYPDATACHAIENVSKEEKQMEKQIGDIIHVVKVICDLAGFEVIGRIQFKHKKSGRMFK